MDIKKEYITDDYTKINQFELELNHFYNMDCMDGMKQIPDKYFQIAR